MTNHLTICNSGAVRPKSQATIPIAKQLDALFDAIPEEELLKALKVYYAGRNGYTYRALWRTYLAMTVLNLPSFAALTRKIVSAKGLYSTRLMLHSCLLSLVNQGQSGQRVSLLWQPTVILDEVF